MFVMLMRESASSGNKYSKIVEEYALSKNMKVIKISANIESQISQLDDDERNEYIDSLGLKEPGLNILISEGYGALRSYHILYFRTERNPSLDN